MRSSLTPLAFLSLFLCSLAVEQLTKGDGWSSWSSWTKCSLSCGIGVKSRGRYCSVDSNSINVGCPGRSRDFATCNHQACPGLAEDPRANQCSQYNDRQIFGNRRTEWQPYFHEQYPCRLYCHPRGYREHFAFGISADGSKCGAWGSQDLCIHGKCMPVGCDLVIGSTTRNDMCSICGGNNSTCYLTKGVIAKIPEQDVIKSGYVEMWIVPKGATRVRITDKSKNYLAVKTVSGSMPVNGNKILTSPRIFELAGTQVRYHRSWDNTLEELEALGPLAEDISIMLSLVLLTSGKVEISYEYYLPESLPGSPGKFPQYATPPPKQWASWGPWTECTVTCAGGIRVRARKCNPLYLGPCYGGDTESKTCNTHPCFGWSMWSNWGACSKSCDGGTKTRHRFCYSSSNTGCEGLVNDSTSCNNHDCYTKSAWLPWEPWGPCSVSCGVGVSMRQRKCNPLTREVCLGPKSGVQICFKGDCIRKDERVRGLTEARLKCKCTKVSGRKAHFCKSDTVLRAVVTNKEKTIDGTMLTVSIRKVFKRASSSAEQTLRVVVSSDCRCPALYMGKEYLIMGNTSLENGKETLSLSRKNFVRKWHQGFDLSLEKIQKTPCK